MSARLLRQTCSAVVISLVGACATVRPPHISARYTGGGIPVPRSDTATVVVFRKGSPPTREYDVIGNVEVSTDGTWTVDDMLVFASHHVRKMGGEALVDVAATDSSLGGIISGSCTAHVYRVRGLVIKWKAVQP